MIFAKHELLFKSSTTLEIREALDILSFQQRRKREFVVKASQVRFLPDGQIAINSDDGSYLLQPHIKAARDLTRKLMGKNTHDYRDKMWEGHDELWVHNMNYWLDANPEEVFMIRGFLDDPDQNTGYARCLLSDTFGFYENLDVANTAIEILSGLKQQFGVSQVTLTPHKFQLRIMCKRHEVKGLREYRGTRLTDPSDSNYAAGIVVGNSEDGSGSLFVAPFERILICPNGMTRMDIAWKKAHRGTRLELGVIASEETKRKQWEADVSSMRDAVRKFLSEEYIGQRISKLEASIESKLENARAAMNNLASTIPSFSEDKLEQLADAFTIGGMYDNPFGISQAFNLVGAQSGDPDFQMETEVLAASITEGEIDWAKYDVPSSEFNSN